MKRGGEGVSDNGWGRESGEARGTLFAGEGEMAAHFRRFDWASSPLGPVASWPPALRAAVRLALDAPLPTALYCGRSYLLLYNDAYRRLLGDKHPAALGQPGAVVWPELWNDFEPQIAAVREGGTSVALDDVRFTVSRAEGSPEEAWFTYALSAVRDEGADGTPGNVVAVLNQVTEATHRVRREAALAAERERLRAVIVAAPAPMALHVGPDHVYAVVNDAYRRISGGRDVTGLAARAAFPDLASHALFEMIDRVYATGEPWGAPETPLRYDRDGTGVQDTWYNLRFEPVRDAAGQVTGVLNFSFDVTDQVRARQETERLLGESEAARQALLAANAELEAHRLALETANRQLKAAADQLAAQAVQAEAARARGEAVLESIADPFYLLDREWRIIYVNDAAEPLLQTTREALLGRILWEAFPGVIGSPFEMPYRDAMANGRPTSAEAYFPPLGTWFDVRTYPWEGGLMVHFRDIGARKAAEVERERLLAGAEAASRAKSEFLAVMSHELRTPLNAIAGYTEILEMGIRGPVTDAQLADIGRIRRANQHLTGLVTDVLNFTRLDAGRVEFDVAEVPLAPVFADVEALVALQAAAKGLVLDHDGCVHASPDEDHVVLADVEKVRQILVNLLTNAIKFTDSGGRIVIGCETDPAAGVVRVHVTDTGRGIPPDQLSRVFEPFVQVDRNLTHTSQQGVGLGLAISRELARAMGGELTADSTPDVGSTFRLTLPRAAHAADSG